MKKQMILLSMTVPFPFFTPVALADSADLGKPVLCVHDDSAIVVQMLDERKIELVYTNGATATLSFSKQVQPNGAPFFQYKGKTTGLDYKTMTAYLNPDHTTLLLPHSDETTGTYIQYGCQELVANQ